MPSVSACELPPAALLQRHAAGGAYTDAYTVIVPCTLTFGAYVSAFYTTPLFRLERLILRLALRRPSTDEEARQLGRGERERYAAWDVEARAPDQLLLCDLYGRTRSWLMTEALAEGGTRLYFGSAVVPEIDSRTRTRRMAPAFRWLLGFHKLYSVALLSAAARRAMHGSTANSETTPRA